jgi:tRNA(Ile2) C34 agmatinyltransferase TiaS
MVTCDECGVRVSSTGYLGGGIICHECAEAKRTDDDETLQARKERYGGGE